MIEEFTQAQNNGLLRLRESKIISKRAEKLLVDGLRRCTSSSGEPEVILMRLVYLLRGYLLHKDEKWLAANVAWLHAGPQTSWQFLLESQAVEDLNAKMAAGDELPCTFVHIQDYGVIPFNGGCCQCKGPINGHGLCLVDTKTNSCYVYCIPCARKHTTGVH